MLELNGPKQQFCDRISRRQLLRIGALAPLGLSLPGLLSTAQAATSGGSFGRAKRCLLIFMWGGPPHQDMWDLKPEAPVELRGEFQPINSSASGVQVSEHLPQMAGQMHRISLIRSVAHSDNNHSTSAHWMLTGYKHAISAENFGAQGSDHPHLGSVLAQFSPADPALPSFVALPNRIATSAGFVVPGQNGGWLGRKLDPFTIEDRLEKPDFRVPTLAAPEGIESTRVASRFELLRSLDGARRRLDRVAEYQSASTYFQQATELITSERARDAFDLAAESPQMRARYGSGAFAQSLLMARRLLESGVKLVTAYWPGHFGSWDTHEKNFPSLKDILLPAMDQPLATLLDDLGERGMLDDTLVVWSSEFGRTPRINANGGRDHWGACNSVWLAGAGLPGGHVHGQSDRTASMPIEGLVSPADITATMFHLLGVPPETQIFDPQQRPHPISAGRVIRELFGGASA